MPCCACLNAEPATLNRFQSECCTVSPENVMFRTWLLVDVPATRSTVDTLFGAKTGAVVMSSEPAL